ncbi:sphingosine-1-phosphate phosphatase 2 isoform X1 [Aythya fuligula]|uniref:Sphingosine-1-phosphate phosphatase 2 isoform X1 n=2 Tax=Aythya fuligula TaxID=219594 RepID=A0A6J3DIA0_AYTFU|nr:sphingosine-1-phosphate phosphatase 2 isoform X1 [Aythya fuligula]
MGRLLRALRGSQPVARFQRCCGLFPAGDAGAGGGGGGGGGGDPAEESPLLAACNGAAAGPPRRRGGSAGCRPHNGVRGGRGSRGCPQKYVVKNYFYYYLFKFSAALGEEIFYITFLPFTYWNIDHSVSRRMIIIWSIVMYIGQVSKDILKWPRPLSPPVVKLEVRTDAEYGMPSTHAMAATAISFSFLIATMNQYKYPFELGLTAAFVFSTLVCLSRLYTGMHTVLDVIGGALISAVLLVLLYPAWDSIDHLLLTSPFCPLLSIAVPLLLCYNYPKLDYYSPTRADTTTILGAGAGATVGFWLNHQYAAPAYSGENLGFPLITGMTVVLVLARFFTGLFVILLTRQLMKSVVLGTLCYCYKFPISDLEARRRLEVEVPYKFVTYSSVGFTATVIVPLLHGLLGLI